jgi:hypothetical protein
MLDELAGNGVGQPHNSAAGSSPLDDVLTSLQRIHDEDAYYGTSDPGVSETNLLRGLSAMGLIRWCPYPNGFYVLEPLGTQFLATVPDLSIQRWEEYLRMT